MSACVWRSVSTGEQVSDAAMPGRGRVANDLEEAEAASRAHVVPAAKGEHLASVDAVLHLRVSRRGQGYRRIRVGLPVLQREGAGVGHRQCVENTGGAGYRGEGVAPSWGSMCHLK